MSDMDDYAPNKSKAIQDEVTRWVAAGRKSHIRKKADHVIQGRSFWWIFKGMGVMEEALKKNGQSVPNVWVATIDSSGIQTTLLFFANNEAEVLAYIGTLKPKNNPHTTLVKMVKLRLHRIRKEVARHVGCHIYTIPSKRLRIAEMYPLDTIQKLHEVVDQGGNDFYVVKWLGVLLKENSSLTDAIIKEAWDLTEVQDIMES